MRLVIVFLAVVICSAFYSSSFATANPIFFPKNISCVSDDRLLILDQGYLLQFNKKLNRVKIFEQSLEGPKLKSVLKCLPEVNVLKVPKEFEGEGLRVLVNCSDTTIVDAGYLVRLLEDPVTLQLSAELSEQSIVGPKKLEILSCSRKILSVWEYMD